MRPCTKPAHFLLQRVLIERKPLLGELKLRVDRQCADAEPQHQKIVVRIRAFPQVAAAVSDAVDAVLQSDNIFGENLALAFALAKNRPAHLF